MKNCPFSSIAKPRSCNRKHIIGSNTDQNKFLNFKILANIKFSFVFCFSLNMIILDFVFEYKYYNYYKLIGSFQLSQMSEQSLFNTS